MANPVFDAWKKIRGKFQGLNQLLTWIRTTSNWRAIWRYRRQKELLPPIHVRGGPVLYHGPYDSPLLLLDEVFIKQWYEIPGEPPADANMLDIGANIGSVSLYWAYRRPNLRIHCYEPNPAAYSTLQLNIEKNGLKTRVTTSQEALGRSSGTLSLWVDVPTDLSTAYMETSPAEGGKRKDVPMIGIDEVWARIGRKSVWLLKVDTEGAEVDILEGASTEFLAAVQNAIIEYHDNIYPGSLLRCQRVLDAAGFSCRFLHHPWNEGIIYAHR